LVVIIYVICLAWLYSKLLVANGKISLHWLQISKLVLFVTV